MPCKSDLRVETAERARRLQTLDSPWEVLEGADCEVTQDGCVQTVGYPSNYTGGSKCVIQAHLNAYVVEAITFNIGTDTLTVNGVAYSGTALKQSLVFGQMHWNAGATSTNLGWKVCPRSSCSTLICPARYTSKPGSQNIPCAGLLCNHTVDLDTCCLPHCKAPADFLSEGYALDANAGACKEAATPYYVYYSEVHCPVVCSASGESFTSGLTSPISNCPTPGEFVVPQACTPTPAEAPQWSIRGACEAYGADCVQTAGYPAPYTSGCQLHLAGDFDITVVAFDLEDGFDFLNVDGWSATGGAVPAPFVLRSGSTISFDVDSDIAGSGFRLCARPLCSEVSCPYGYIFMCSAVDSPCTEPACEDRNTTCCRTATTAELAAMAPGSTSDAVSEACITTTTTTTTTVRELLQILGYATFSASAPDFNSSLVEEAWQSVLMDLTNSSSEDVWMFPGAPRETPLTVNTTWRIGYQIQNLPLGGEFGQESGELDYTASFLSSALQSRLARFVDTVVLANVATSDEGYFRAGKNPKCHDYAPWADDHGHTCAIYEHLCTIDGVSSSASISYVDGYYWYFYNSVARTDPDAPDAREACCSCGGGNCADGTFKLRGTNPDFCAPCSPGYFSDNQDGAVQIGDACTPCASGRFTGAIGSRRCIPADIGHYACCEGADHDLHCHPGTFAAEEGLSVCPDCAVGKFALVAAVECDLCEEGKYAGVEGTSACSDCPRGTFANLTGLSVCFDCPVGTSTIPGQVACSDCAPGTFSASEGSSECSACPLGKHMTDRGSTECVLCEPGWYAGIVGLSECDICPGGEQSTTHGATACVSCQIGEAKEEGLLECQSCSPGYFSDRSGESECLPCAPGREVNETGATACNDCPPGRASEIAGYSVCPACAAGRFIDSAGESACVDCFEGQFAGGAGQTACEACSPGSAGREEGLTACVPCSPGRFISDAGATGCIDCSIRQYAPTLGMAECDNCPVGKFGFLQGLSACFDCQAGRYADVNGTSECTHCEFGKYIGTTRNTGCHLCSESLPGPAEFWTTMYPTNQSNGEIRWDLMLGATDISSCGCKPGTQPEGAVDINYVDGGSPLDPIGGRGHGCKWCGEGLNCLGMGQLRILEDYAWDGELSVYDCTHATVEACSGGVPGACMPGRDEAKVACAECLSGWVPNTDGSCSECSGLDYGVPALATTVMVVLACLMYMAYDRPGPRKRPSLSVLLILISMGQVLSMIQQLGIVASIRVEWDNPLAAILEFVVSISFLDVDLLRPGCMVSMNPVRSYGLRVLLVYIALSMVILAHFLSTLIQHRHGRSKLHWFTLMCALGTIIMAFFVSIITTMLGPLQCKKHPNSSRTIAWYPSVLCWEDSRHAQMIVIGIVACTLPALFLAGASYAAYRFPRALKKGSSRFLTGWAFLFFRYHASAYWYGPIQLTRNALISAAPVLPTPVLQTLFLETVMLVSLLIVARVMPWRAHSANYLEVVMHCVFLCLMLIACLFIDDKPGEEIAVLATVLILAMPFVVIVLIIKGLIRLCQSQGKPYQFFLCHHKAGAGSFSRLLKMRLLNTRGVTRKVFVDTDDLQNLGTLFDLVDQDTESLVAIHSSHLLTRPWCVGEITTAYRAKVQIQVVRLSLVDKPTEHFIQNFTGFVPDTAALTENGISIEMVEEALTHFQTLTAIRLPAELHDKTVTGLCTALVGKMGATASHDIKAEEGDDVAEGSLLIISDKKDLEAASTAFILRELIVPIIAPASAVTANVLTHGKALPAGISRVALVCTEGLFGNPIITNLLSLASMDSSLLVLPLMCSNTFVFPTQQVLRESSVTSSLQKGDQDRLVVMMQSVFTEIAVEFKPAALGATEALLQARAQDIANRLWSKMQTVRERMALVQESTQKASSKSSETRLERPSQLSVNITPSREVSQNEGTNSESDKPLKTENIKFEAETDKPAMSDKPIKFEMETDTPSAPIKFEMETDGPSAPIKFEMEI